MQVRALESVVFSSKLSSALKSGCLEKGLRDRQSALSLEAPSVPPTALEKLKEWMTFAPVRTHNRSRSLRLAASGLWSKVCKGSRQDGSLTLGEGLALRTGCRDLCSWLELS